MKRIALLCLAMLLAWSGAPAHAADAYPSKPLRLLVPFPAGGATDAILRVVAQKLSENLGQPVVVDNRPGGGTIIATGAGAKSPPDGYTLIGVTAAFAVNPSLYKQLPYNTEKDFVPVTLVSSAPNVLVVHPSVPASNVKDLIAYAKANPRQLNFGSAGNGTSNHLAGEMFKTMADVDIVHVPYKGDGPSITDLLGGRIQMLFIGLGPVAPHIKAGKLKAIAVTSAAPTPLVPDVPTLASSVPGFESAVWNGIVLPAGTPPEIVSRLHAEIAKILAQPDTREKIAGMGFEPVGSSPAQFREHLALEGRRAAKVVSEANIRID